MTGDAFSVKKQVKPMVNQRSPQPVPQPVRPVQTPPRPVQSQQPPRTPKKPTQNELEFFNDTMEDLIGTRAAFMIDEKLNVLGKIPVSELISTIRSLSSGVYAIMLDDVIDQELLNSAERANVMFLVAMDTKVKSSRLTIITADEL